MFFKFTLHTSFFPKKLICKFFHIFSLIFTFRPSVSFCTFKSYTKHIFSKIIYTQLCWITVFIRFTRFTRNFLNLSQFFLTVLNLTHIECRIRTVIEVLFSFFVWHSITQWEANLADNMLLSPTLCVFVIFFSGKWSG